MWPGEILAMLKTCKQISWDVAPVGLYDAY